MDYRTLAQSLGGRPFHGRDEYYHVPDLTFEQIRAAAGTRGRVRRLRRGQVLLEFPVAEGTAFVLGALDPADATEVLHDASMMLIADGPSAPPPGSLAGDTRPAAPNPPPN